MKGNFTALNASLTNEGKFQTRPSSNIKIIEKQEQRKPKASRRWKMTKKKPQLKTEKQRKSMKNN